MQQATIVVSYSDQVFSFVIGRREILSLQIVRNWLVVFDRTITIVLCSGNLSSLSQ